MFCMQSTKVFSSGTRVSRFNLEVERSSSSSALRALVRSCKHTNIFSESDGISALGELTGEGEFSLRALPVGRGERDRSVVEFRREDRNRP
jgi:hypothetical protein